MSPTTNTTAADLRLAQNHGNKATQEVCLGEARARSRDCWYASEESERGGSDQGGADALRHACRDENAQRGCEAVGAGTTAKTATPRP